MAAFDIVFVLLPARMPQTLEKPATQLHEDQPASTTAEGDTSSSTQPPRGVDNAPAAPSKQSVQRKLLVILHGKRLDDDQVRNAIQVGAVLAAAETHAAAFCRQRAAPATGSRIPSCLRVIQLLT